MAAQKEQQTTRTSFALRSNHQNHTQILVTTFAKSSDEDGLGNIIIEHTARVQQTIFPVLRVVVVVDKSSSRVNAFGKSFPRSRQAQNHHQRQRRQRQTLQTPCASSKKRPKKQRENIYTMPDIGTTPYQMKDDLPAKGPEFDLSQKKATATVFRRERRERRGDNRN